MLQDYITAIHFYLTSTLALYSGDIQYILHLPSLNKANYCCYIWRKGYAVSSYFYGYGVLYILPIRIDSLKNSSKERNLNTILTYCTDESKNVTYIVHDIVTPYRMENKLFYLIFLYLKYTPANWIVQWRRLNNINSSHCTKVQSPFIY